MNNAIKSINKISEHSLIEKVSIDATPIIQKDIKTKRENLDNELQYYVWNFFYCLLKLVNLCKRINYNAISLNQVLSQSVMKKHDIKKHDCLQYNIEDYHIRLASFRDLIFITLNAVFNLHNNPRNCNYKIISENLKVKQSDILKTVNDLYSLLEENIKHRNSILHEYEYSNKELEQIELLELCLNSKNIKKKKADMFRSLKKDKTTECVKKTKIEFLKINEELYKKLTIYFDKLEKIYQDEKTKLEKIYKND